MTLPPVVLMSLAALAYAFGGVCMKLSDGLTRFWWAAGTYALFCLGATIQALVMKKGELGVVYMLVIGGEAIIAFGLGAWFFGETVTGMRLLALGFIVTGMALLR